MYLPPDVPNWCLVRRGAGPLLLVAPHGGTRHVARPAKSPLKVNDLHTAVLGEELASALDASLVANPTLDRNELDLNRISQVARSAPWFPTLLETLLAEILDRHSRAEVVFLHGWNTLQPKVDIGVGHPLRHAADAARHASTLTASVAYVTSRLVALQAACAARGIATPFGERYPARHANNVLQLFRRIGPAALAPRLRAWAAVGRVDAVQLELAAPLRWPGPLRQAFGAAMREAFAAPRRGREGPADAVPRTAAAAGSPTPPHSASPPALALQAYDPARRIGLLARVDPHGAAGASGRLLLFLDDGRVALFTGEDPHAEDLARTGPRFATAAGGGLRLAFTGWALCAPDGALYVDLEQALAASRLMAVRTDLTFSPHAGGHGRVHGTLAIDDSPFAVDAIGFVPSRSALPTADIGWRSHLVLHAALSDGGTLALRHRVPGGTIVQRGGSAAVRPRSHVLSIRFDGEPDTPSRMVLHGDGEEIVAVATSRLAIVRPLAAGRRARVTFGVARVTQGDAHAYGFYEYARVLS